MQSDLVQSDLILPAPAHTMNLYMLVYTSFQKTGTYNHIQGYTFLYFLSLKLFSHFFRDIIARMMILYILSPNKVLQRHTKHCDLLDP